MDRSTHLRASVDDVPIGRECADAPGRTELKPHPILDSLGTRALERREVVRRFVLSADVEQLERASAVLRTTDGESSLWTRWPSGTNPEPAQHVRDNALHRGSLRIDLVTNRIARVRYAPGDAVGGRAGMARLQQPLAVVVMNDRRTDVETCPRRRDDLLAPPAARADSPPSALRH